GADTSKASATPALPMDRQATTRSRSRMGDVILFSFRRCGQALRGANWLPFLRLAERSAARRRDGPARSSKGPEVDRRGKQTTCHSIAEATMMKRRADIRVRGRVMRRLPAKCVDVTNRGALLTHIALQSAPFDLRADAARWPIGVVRRAAPVFPTRQRQDGGS